LQLSDRSAVLSNKYFFEGREAAPEAWTFGIKVIKVLAGMGDGCYPVSLVLLAKIYCKGLITGNSQWVHL